MVTEQREDENTNTLKSGKLKRDDREQGEKETSNTLKVRVRRRMVESSGKEKESDERGSF